MCPRRMDVWDVAAGLKRHRCCDDLSAGPPSRGFIRKNGSRTLGGSKIPSQALTARMFMRDRRPLVDNRTGSAPRIGQIAK